MFYSLQKHLTLAAWCAAFVACLCGSAFGQDTKVRIQVDGVVAKQKDNVEATLALPPGIVQDNVVEERLLQRFVENIPENVARAFEPFGYYHSKSKVLQVKDSSGNYGIHVDIEAGPPVRIRSLSVRVTGDGANNREILRARRAFPLAEGSRLDHQAYEQGKLDLRLAANEQGYIDARYAVRTIRVFPEENVADVELVLGTGPRFFFGDIRFEEQSGIFDESFLQRYLAFQEGDVFSHKAVHQTRLSFYAANRFDEVLILPLRDEAVDQRVPVVVKLSPGKMQRLRPGIGYATNTGARVTVNYQHMNIHKGAHALLGDLSIAEIRQFVEFNYKIPQPTTDKDNLIGTVGYLNEDIKIYTSKMVYTEIERTFGLGAGQTGSLALRYFREDYEIGDEDGVAHAMMPIVRYHRRSYDDPLNPTRGFQYRLELRGAHDDLLSDISFAQVIAAGSFMYPLSQRFSLLSRIEGATSITKDRDTTNYPPSLRFFVGGDNTVRGYAYKSRGPRDKNDDVVGGDSLLVGSVECEYKLNDDWGLAVFYDIGSAYNAFYDIEFIQGAGVGVRRFTPIGPIKVDFANRVSESHHSVRVHFSIGFDI
ncbi:MAG: outer membrane protein assembly factor [Deltaproteobacteria bacterium]|nr:outer membrane protein assembly factor [Deltaproteobacteria bacterium]